MKLNRILGNYVSLITSKLQSLDKLYSVADSAVISISRFAAGIALAKLAGSEAFALYLMLMTSSFFILSIPSTLCIVPMINLASGLQSQQMFEIINWTQIKLRRFYFGAIVIAIFAYPIANNFSVSPAFYLGFICATLAGLDLLFQRACLQIRFRMKIAAAADTIGLLLLSAIVYGFWFYLDAPVLGFWWGCAISSLVASRVMKSLVKTKQESDAENNYATPTTAIRKQASRSGAAMLFGSIANTACARIAPFVLGNIGGLISVASFGASWTLVGPLRMLSGAISGLLRPRLAMYINKADSKAFDASLKLAYLLIISVGICGTIVAAFIGPALVSMLFDPSLAGAGRLLPLAMIYATLEVITNTQVIALQTKLRNGAQIASKLRVVAAVVSLILIYPACLWFGPLGAYITLLLSEFVYFGASRRYLRTPAKPGIKKEVPFYPKADMIV